MNQLKDQSHIDQFKNKEFSDDIARKLDGLLLQEIKNIHANHQNLTKFELFRKLKDQQDLNTNHKINKWIKPKFTFKQSVQSW